MKNNKFYKISTSILFGLWILIFAFQLVKVGVWSSHRDLINQDYRYIAGVIEQMILVIIWFTFTMLYELKGKFRKTSFAFYLVGIFLAVGVIYSKVDLFNQFVNTNLALDKFTTTFEMIYTITFAILFVTYFTYLLVKKHFKKK